MMTQHTTTFRRTVNQVIAANSEYDDATDLDLGDAVHVERDGYEDLGIERIRENKISVMHTYKQRGDLMRNPEIVFNTSDDEWLPVEFRQDPIHHQHNDDGVDCGDFIRTWARNLDNQGFTQ